MACLSYSRASRRLLYQQTGLLQCPTKYRQTSTANDDSGLLIQAISGSTEVSAEASSSMQITLFNRKTACFHYLARSRASLLARRLSFARISHTNGDQNPSKMGLFQSKEKTPTIVNAVAVSGSSMPFGTSQHLIDSVHGFSWRASISLAALNHLRIIPPANSEIISAVAALAEAAAHPAAGKPHENGVYRRDLPPQELFEFWVFWAFKSDLLFF